MKLLHLIELSRWPNLKKPKDINEKLMWLEFNTDTSEWSRLADKHEVREYIRQKGFESNLIPTLGLYNAYDEIDFNSLPESFVIKTTNGCRQTEIVKNKNLIDHERLKNKIANWLAKPFGYATGEKHYQIIKPRIIIEKLLSDEEGKIPIDYKFYCFRGKVEACLVCTERDLKTQEYKLNLFNPEGWEEFQDSIIPSMRGKTDASKPPKNLQKMVEMASKLSENFPFVRVDLYEVGEKVYFGELTFTPSGCRSYNLTTKMLNEFGEKILLERF